MVVPQGKLQTDNNQVTVDRSENANIRPAIINKEDRVVKLVVCNQCGNVDEPSAAICSQCGSPVRPSAVLPVENQPKLVLCPKCGMKNEMGMRNCSRCSEDFVGKRMRVCRPDPPSPTFAWIKIQERIPKSVQTALNFKGEESAFRVIHATLSHVNPADQTPAAVASALFGPGVPQSPRWAGLMVTTDRRFIFMEEKGLMTKTYTAKESIPFEHVTGTSYVTSAFSKGIRISAQLHGREWYLIGLKELNWVDNGWVNASIVEVKKFAEYQIRKRMTEIETQKRRDKIQFVIDFSFVKQEMAKGGITIQSVKCPNCGGAVNLPSTGNLTKCDYCGSSLYAQDVFDRIQKLIDGI